MNISFRKFSIFLLVNVLSILGLSASSQNSIGPLNQNNIEQGSCPCGCACPAPCKCGCIENGNCSCHEKSEDRSHLYADCEEDMSYQRSIPEGAIDDCDFARSYGLSGIWMPECPLLFKPFVADPRQVCYSVGWRFNDKALTKNVIPVSYGDTFSIYRWFNVGFCGMYGELQIDMEGGLWAVFDPITYSSPLIDADYYVGFPLTYRTGPWSMRLRGYHISTHIGDEFLLNHPGFDRRNPSAEWLDFFVSYDMTQDIRVYCGIGYTLEQDESFKCGRWYSAAGTEVRLMEIAYYDYCDRLYGVPFCGMYFRFQKDYKNHIDSTYVLGYEWGKLSGLQRKIRLFMEYHDGYSPDGQFCRFATNYFSVRLLYGY